MKNLITALRVSVIATLVLGVLVSFVYPLAVWGVSQVVFPNEANGSLIVKDGKVIGSELLGQNFSAPNYFHSRPSAAGKGYDAASSGGSNLGPISDKFLNGVVDNPDTKDVDESFAGLKQRAQAYRETNQLAPDALIPADAVTASASGLDPHISPANAALQAPRVAKARGLTEEQLRLLIVDATEQADLGILGEARVNVLMLNLSLDRQP